MIIHQQPIAKYGLIALVLLTLTSFVSFGQSKEVEYCPLSVTIVDKFDSKPVEYVVVQIMPYGIWSVSDSKGVAHFNKVPLGKCTIETTMLGYSAKPFDYVISPKAANTVKIEMEIVSLAMDDVVVVAKSSKSGNSTASVIERQAIDHLQATSIKDILQLIPGQVVTSNPSLTSMGQFTARTLDKNDSNNAFGAQIMIDGVPVSNNADMNTKGGTFSTASAGVDMRSIGTDNIESVEIIRGIASAEYGDVASGTMIVQSKVGISDAKFRMKIMPGITQMYAGKGFGLGKAGSINVDFDYANGKSDPRYTTDTYDRYLASAIHSFSFWDNKITITTKINGTFVKDWSGPDPDEKVQDVYKQTTEKGFTVSQSGKFNLDALFARSLKYDLAYSYKESNSFTRSLISGATPFFNSTETGTYSATLLPLQYYSGGGSIGKPVSFYAKISDNFYLNAGKFKNRFNIGVEYKNEGNIGSGYYDLDPSLPLSTAAVRVRPFNAVPFLNQLSAYAEDNISINFNTEENPYPAIKAQIGARWTMILSGKEHRMTSLSPRINASFLPWKWLELKFGMGISEKTPSLLMLYPEKGYFDFMNINYSNNSKEYLGVYSTRIIDHTPSELEPMRSTKYEFGLNIKTNTGQIFSVVVYDERIFNGFASDNSNWVSYQFDRWVSSDITNNNGNFYYDKNNPSSRDTVLQSVSKTSNRQSHHSRGIEFDFNLGRIEATKTSFYLTGAYTQTKYNSTNNTYTPPKGNNKVYNDIYLVYKGSSNNVEKRQLSSLLRVVQSIPRLKFVVSAAVQAIFYDYSLTKSLLSTPLGYIVSDGNFSDNSQSGVKFIEFTEQQLANPQEVTFNGFKLSDNIYSKSAYTDVPETWPPLWVINMRVTKDITKYLGFSFYVNNMFFSQPWHSSSISTSKSERNTNLFSYGFEAYINF